MKLHRLFWLAAFGLSLMPAPFAAAQEAGAQAPDTDQTDQQEDDWRNQNRVGSSNPFDPRPNSSNQGWGVNMPQMDPVDQLPEESRRHLAQMRTQAITSADLENPDFENIAYEPSDAAQGDPDLMAREQAAWEDILADMQAATGGGGGSQPDAQPVVMAGQGTGTGGGSGMQPTAMSGGGNQSAAEMLAQMGRAGGQAGQGGSPGSTQASQGGAQTSAAEMLRQMGQGAGDAAGAGAGQSASQAEGGGTQASGSGQSDGGESAEAGSQTAGEGQSDGQQGDADGAEADGDGTDVGQDGYDAGDSGADAGEEAETPPRPTPSFGSTQTSQSGTQTSAGDFLKNQPETGED